MNTFSTPDRVRRLAACMLVIVLAVGCTSAPDANDPDAVAEMREINDPVEPLNRSIFEINRTLDKAIRNPVATVYRDLVPSPIQVGLHNLLDNLRAPIIIFNDLLQGEMDRALTTLIRFVLNSTFGIAGLADIAAEFGLEGHNEDFGQTLAVWGIGEGPYIMLPVFGPSNPRDTIGIVVDFLIDPFNTWARNTEREFAPFARSAAQSVDLRSNNLDLLDDLEKLSLDFYAAIRSLYRQRRSGEINNGKGSANFPAPGLSMAPEVPALIELQEISGLH